jgi:hypothetical protein
MRRRGVHTYTSSCQIKYADVVVAALIDTGRFGEAVFHSSILGQTYETLQALISLGWLFVPQPTHFETTRS